MLTLLSRNRIAVATLAAAMAAATATPAMAETMINEGLAPRDPVMVWAEEMAPANTFFLNGREDTELVRFKTPRDIDVCIARATPDVIGDANKAYPVTVKWDGNDSTIKPGNCMSFDAARVKLRPATDLPSNVDITGTVRVHHGATR